MFLVKYYKLRPLIQITLSTVYCLLSCKHCSNTLHSFFVGEQILLKPMSKSVIVVADSCIITVYNCIVPKKLRGIN